MSEAELSSDRVIRTVYFEENVPDIDELTKLEAFDSLCFAGAGKTTSEKYAPPTMRAEEIGEDIEKHHNIFVVKKDLAGEIVSVMVYFIKSKPDKETEVHLMSMAIRPDCRKKGLADKALDELEEIAKKEGINKITLRVDPLNSPAINKYLHWGFVVAGGRTKNVDIDHTNVVTLAATKRLDCIPSFEPDEVLIRVDNYQMVDELAKSGFAGVTITDELLVMKKLTEESRKIYPSWS